MPTGYVIVDAHTVRGPDGREHDVLDAISALPWKAQLCPLMRHEYSIWGQGPEWAWNVLSSMLLARNPDSYAAYFRGYQSANRYWDAPDDLRYWRGRYEIDRGKRDSAGLRRLDEGAKPAKDWDGPPYAPNGIGLYDRDIKGRWWPTEAALASGYLPCSSCEQTNRKLAITVCPKDPHRVAAFIAVAAFERGRALTRDELGRVLERYPASTDRSSVQSGDGRNDLDRGVDASFVPETKWEVAVESGSVSKGEVVRKLLELRAREAPLGFSGYRGVLTQKAIAAVAGVRVQDVTKAAIALDAEAKAAKAKKAG